MISEAFANQGKQSGFQACPPIPTALVVLTPVCFLHLWSDGAHSLAEETTQKQGQTNAADERPETC